MENKIRVHLKQNSYNIYFGSNFLKNFFLSNINIKKNNIVIITNHVIYDILHTIKYKNFFSMIKHIPVFIIKDGERYKNLDTIKKIISFLLDQSYNRNLVLIALGGGVIGDITGFVASIYQRGINFIQIPTTLLAQVDSSIGGKTGVNHALGKNMIGSFWQPKKVLIDLHFLDTLPKRQFLSGLAEVIKYAIIFDKTFFIWLEKNFLNICHLQKNELLYCIKKCCELKAKVVEHDEKENNKRIFLNLGHSFAHAIETYTGYGAWLHGDAVAVGIVMAAYFSFSLQLLKKKYLFRIIKIFHVIGLPIAGPKDMSPNSYLKFMSKDKKVLNNVIRLVLPVSIGKVRLFSSIDQKRLLHFIQKFQKKNFLDYI